MLYFFCILYCSQWQMNCITNRYCLLLWLILTQATASLYQTAHQIKIWPDYPDDDPPSHLHLVGKLNQSTVDVLTGCHMYSEFIYGRIHEWNGVLWFKDIFLAAWKNCTVHFQAAALPILRDFEVWKTLTDIITKWNVWFSKSDVRTGVN